MALVGRRVRDAWPLGLALVSSPALGAPSARLAYVREPGAERCADEEGLRKAVAARLGYDPFFVWAKVTVVAHVHKDPRGYRADVTLVDETGVSRGTRSLATQGDDCAPLVGALAISISLALDPLSRREAPEKKPEPPPPPPPDARRDPAREPREAPVSPAPAPPPAPPAPTSPAWRGWIGLAATGTDGLTPGVASGGLARARLDRGWLSLALEAGADLPTATSVAGGGSASAWTARATLVGCGRVSLFVGCAAAWGGALAARGVGLTTSRSAVVGIGGVGPRIGIEWALSRRFTMDAFAEVAFAVARRALQVGGIDAFREPLAAPRLGIGISTRIF